MLSKIQTVIINKKEHEKDSFAPPRRKCLEQGEPVYFTLQDPNATGISDMNLAEAMKVTVCEDHIQVKNVNGTVAVYDVAGKLVDAKEADGSVTFVIQETGCYIIRCGGEVAKVIVK